MLLIESGFVYFLYLLHYGSALECLLCTDVVSITECLNQRITCASGEVCGIMVTLLGKRSLSPRNLGGCSDCCNSPSDHLGPCNAKLCGQRPQDTTVRCLSCLNKASAAVCLSRQTCPETQVCANEIVVTGGNSVRFNFYCEERQLCQAMYEKPKKVIQGRRRAYGNLSGTSICNSCCIGNECNKADCYELEKSYNYSSFAPVART